MSAELGSWMKRIWRAALQETSLLELGEAASAIGGMTARDAEDFIVMFVEPFAVPASGAPLWRWGDIMSALSAVEQPNRRKGSLNDHNDAACVPDTRPDVEAEDPSEYLGPAQVATRLGISRRTLTRCLTELREKAPHLLPMDVGNGRDRSRWRWNERDVEPWFEEVQRWRASNHAMEATGSAGATRMGGRAQSSARTGGPPSSSPQTSSNALRRGSRDSLRNQIRLKRRKP
jgi:AraC-like DNA-binding protein